MDMLVIDLFFRECVIDESSWKLEELVWQKYRRIKSEVDVVMILLKTCRGSDHARWAPWGVRGYLPNRDADPATSSLLVESSESSCAYVLSVEDVLQNKTWCIESIEIEEIIVFCVALLYWSKTIHQNNCMIFWLLQMFANDVAIVRL